MKNYLKHKMDEIFNDNAFAYEYDGETIEQEMQRSWDIEREKLAKELQRGMWDE